MGSPVVTPPATAGDIDPGDIRRELDRIIASPVFRGSKRCQSFLQYVVGRTLDGEGRLLKERTLAIEVFGRDESGDLTDDSIVRVGAREVRKRLAQYYVDEGAHDNIRIELAAGSYIPSFHCQPLQNVVPVVPAAPAIDAPPPSSLVGVTSSSRPVATLLGVAAILLVAGALWRTGGLPTSLFNQFWNPAFHTGTPPMILLAHPIVYQPSSRASHLDEVQNGPAMPPAQRVLHVEPSLLNGNDYVPAMDQFVGFGDAEAALRMSSLLVEHGLHPAVRLASRVDFYDLRQTAAVLIGAFTNRWTVELTKTMRYRFGYGNGKPCIAEGTVCRWTLATKSDNGKSTEDYILLARLPHPPTNGFVVIGAGLNVYGTEEAGRILSDNESLTRILRGLPSNWTSRNLELVLHVSVVGDAPAQSEVVSVHTW